MAGQACFGGYWCPIFLDKITRQTSYLTSSRPHEGSPSVLLGMSLTPVNNMGPEQIESRLPPQPHTAPQVSVHTQDTVMPENPSVGINCCDVNPTAAILPRSRSTTINCCDVNPTAIILPRSQSTTINCCDVNPTVTIFPRSQSTTINCCDVNPTLTIYSRNQGTWMFQSWIKFGSEARTHKSVGGGTYNVWKAWELQSLG